MSFILDKRNNISKNSANTVYQMDHMKYNKYSLVYESNVDGELISVTDTPFPKGAQQTPWFSHC